MKRFVGIDCGKTGGIVSIGHNQCIDRKLIMPTMPDGKKKKINIKALNDIIIFLNILDPIFIVEDPGGHAPSAAGLRSMTYSFAVVEALLVVNQCSYINVTARKWQKEFWTKPKELKGQKWNTKEQALNSANEIWPNTDWRQNDRCRVAHDGIVDAALIGMYGFRQK
jgi:hypothetical protein